MSVDGPQLVYLHEGLFGVFLGFVHKSRLHGVHDRDEVDEDAELFFRHPMKLFHRLVRGFVVFFGQSGDALNGLLELLQGILHFFHLTQHQMTGDLARMESRWEINIERPHRATDRDQG